MNKMKVSREGRKCSHSSCPDGSGDYVRLCEISIRPNISFTDRIPSNNPGAEPPRDSSDSGSARSHSMHLESSSSDRP